MSNFGLLPYSKQTRDLNVKTDILLVEQNMSEFIYNPDVGRAFLSITQHPAAILKKMSKFYYIKERVCIAK